MKRSRTTVLMLILALSTALFEPAAALGSTPRAADGEVVITDRDARGALSWAVGNTVVGGVSTPSVTECYRTKPCRTFALRVPADAPRGGRVESISTPRRQGAIASGVVFSSTGDVPVNWYYTKYQTPPNKWVLEDYSLVRAFGTGLSAVAVTGSSAAGVGDAWYVLRRTVAGPSDRGTDVLVQRTDNTAYRVVNLLGCATRGQTLNDVVTVHDRLAVVGNCGTATSRLPRVYLYRTEGVVDVTGDLPEGVRWTRATRTTGEGGSDRLQVSGEPAAGGPTVTYVLTSGSWAPVSDTTT